MRGVDQDDDKRQLVENLVSYAHVRGIALVGGVWKRVPSWRLWLRWAWIMCRAIFLARLALLPPPRHAGGG